ncbi:universal stress protein [Rhodococcus wratislaviensis]|uniref:universal stress protein n=1 Tax=Rhodococcus wratislaviensis TaxID=44752 RepID=UPI001FEAB080|nr:universal stress protein [Rhodococcus wratislaviensis]
MAGAFLGSTSQNLLHHVACPITICRRASDSACAPSLVQVFYLSAVARCHHHRLYTTLDTVH